MTQLQRTSSTPETTCTTECHLCGETLPARKLHEADGNYFCESCLNDKGYVLCSDCGFVEKSKYSVETSSGDIVCDDCYTDHYFTCNACENIKHNDDGCYIESEDVTVCSRCFDRHYFTCSACSDSYSIDNAMTDNDGDVYCESCWSRRCRQCDECEEYVDSDDVTYIDDHCYCSNCAPKNNINHYFYKPAPVFFGSGKFHMGIEIEIYCDSVVRSLNVFTHEDLQRMYLKKDASVHHGFEIVSHPMTMEEHRTFDWENLCDRLIESGAKGNVEDCGIHVHISKTYLSENERLKLSWFFCHHIEQIRKLARRDECYHEHASPEEIINRVKSDKKYQNDGKGVARYEILNWKCADTVEFRLPQSTLRYETIMAIFELCDAAVQFVRTDVNFITLQNCWDRFMVWCNENNYKYLVGYYFGYLFGDVAVEEGYEEI